MKRIIIGGALSGIVLAALAPAAVAAETVTIRPDDLNTNDTRATGHVDFLGDGLHVWTEGTTSTDKAAGYFATEGGLPTSASMEWFGSAVRPGQQIVFDADGIDGNGNDYNLLVGEPAYGENWWLTPSSSADAKAADPSAEQNGGNGSEWFGTLAEWSAALPEARFYAGGFSLGSGVKGDGVIGSITYGETVYEFTDEAAAVATTPEAYSSSRAVGRKAIVKFGTEERPAGAVLGDRVTWKLLVDGKRVLRARDGFSAQHRWTERFPRKSGRHVVNLVRNGDTVETLVVRTGR